MKRRAGGIGVRVAAIALAVAALALAILGLGVMIVGAQSFAQLMAAHGISIGSSEQMFQDSVAWVVVLAAAVAVGVTVLLAVLLGRRLARPLREMSAAARRIARGDYASRVPRTGPEEMVSLADSFNQMAGALEEQERLRREFIANAAHELRTPLTNLKGYLEGLRDGVITADHETFDSLLDETERLVRLSRSLDTLAAGDVAAADELRDVDLVPLVRAASDLAMPALTAAGIELRVDMPATLPAHGNPDHLAQVLANLLQNAVRYTPRGGTVTISGRPMPDDVLVSVTNTGATIPQADLPHVFERFYRVEKSRDAARGGAGIGLSIVSQLVEAAGGHVGVESGEDVTRFWFSVPR